MCPSLIEDSYPVFFLSECVSFIFSLDMQTCMQRLKALQPVVPVYTTYDWQHTP